MVNTFLRTKHKWIAFNLNEKKKSCEDYNFNFLIHNQSNFSLSQGNFSVPTVQSMNRRFETSVGF
jgi:hypothetical protein